MFVISDLFRITLVVLAILSSLGIANTSIFAQKVDSPSSRPVGLPDGAISMPSLSSDATHVYRDAQTLWLLPTQSSLDAGKLNLPRLCAPIRSLSWSDDPDREPKFVPEPDHWVFSWKDSVDPGVMIKVVFDGDPLLPGQCSPAKAAGDGSIMLLAHQATTFGEKLRFEPQWYKNTVGYWTVPTDYATWDLRIDAAGDYSVAVLQGCGQGQGDSDALITIRDAQATVDQLAFQTVDTGHFQNFRWNHLGHVKIDKPGEYQLRINADKISKNALFDVRAIHLVKQAK